MDISSEKIEEIEQFVEDLINEEIDIPKNVLVFPIGKLKMFLQRHRDGQEIILELK
ncbi:MAG: hypothetical protein ISR65_10100 [Bacteriovoracaceae bacterium]|nr:hypothetical protein [Bacteriovoracaceae bacterium]